MSHDIDNGPPTAFFRPDAGRRKRRCGRMIVEGGRRGTRPGARPNEARCSGAAISLMIIIRTLFGWRSSLMGALYELEKAGKAVIGGSQPKRRSHEATKRRREDKPRWARNRAGT